MSLANKIVRKQKIQKNQKNFNCSPGMHALLKLMNMREIEHLGTNSVKFENFFAFA